MSGTTFSHRVAKGGRIPDSTNYRTVGHWVRVVSLTLRDVTTLTTRDFYHLRGGILGKFISDLCWTYRHNITVKILRKFTYMKNNVKVFKTVYVSKCISGDTSCVSCQDGSGVLIKLDEKTSVWIRVRIRERW